MSQSSDRQEIKVQSERTVLAAVRLPDSTFDPRDPFGELRSLAEQAGAMVVGEMSQNLPKPSTGTYMGSGKIAELRTLCEELQATTIIFDHDLSPKQIGNIEKETKRKVLDRSELILDIFAGRAASAEAKLQVELAQLEYTYPRLRAMWSHLERISGGIGSRGPGEQQLEIDRRLVQAKKDDLTRQIREIHARKRREVQNRKLEHFTVGIVGYTNAGKSTLFNTLTAGGAYADNRLFATLMTRTRGWDLGNGLEVMISDTVGFVRDLPTNLIAAFRATLEEATHADVLLIVLDVSDPAAELQFNAVMSTLDDLMKEISGSAEEVIAGWKPPQRIVLLNKADRLTDNSALLVWQQKVSQYEGLDGSSAIAISALPPPPGVDLMEHLGHRELLERVRDLARGQIDEVLVTLPMSESRAVHFVENRGQVLDRTYDEENVTLKVRIGRRLLEQLKAGGSRLTVRFGNGEVLTLAGRTTPGTIERWQTR